MKKLGLIVGGMFVIAGAIIYMNTGTVFGMTIGNFVNKTTGYTEYYSFFTATTTTATSTNNLINDGHFKIAGAKNVTMYFSRGGANGANTGSTLFKIEVSPDGVNYFPYNTLRLNQATTSYPNANATVVISAATTTSLAQMRDLGFYSIRCVAIETTDGEHTCKAEAEF